MDRKEFREALKYFEDMMLLLKQHDYAEILEQAALFLEAAPETLEEKFIGFYSKGMERGRYSLVLRDLIRNRSQLEWVYSKIADVRDRQVFGNLILYRMVPAPSVLEKISDKTEAFLQEKEGCLVIDENGLEISRLLEEKRRIRNDFPKLAVCVSTVISDIWEIPRLIDAIRPGYRFFFRHYEDARGGKTFLYAIPPEKQTLERPAPKKEKRVVYLAAYEGWQDVQLVKECGTIPYLLYKNHGCRASMVGARLAEEYKNLSYVDGLLMEFLPDGSIETKAEYIRQNARDIDALLLRGPYNTYYYPAKLYKELNPFGKIYLSLDPNPYWMDIIDWKDPIFSEFLDRCDVIGSNDKVMQEHLTEKWRWNIDYFPNGFYNFTGDVLERPFEEKANVILTVGRLGTEQKQTHVMLEGFAKIADRIPDWELRLVGTVEPAFEPYLNAFWEKYPALNERIRFVGKITDRKLLYEEYRNAKIFTLTSELEGFPNVVSEALAMGCALAVTKTHAWREFIDDGRCGMSSEIADVAGYADILLRMCTGDGLKQMCEHAMAYASEVFDMEKITDRLYQRLFGEE